MAKSNDETTSALDRMVERALVALRTRKAAAPRALCILGTGLGLFPERLDDAREFDLAGVDGVPEPWRAARLVAGRFEELDLWLLEDHSLDDCEGPAWQRAFPCWLAAAAGARVLVLGTAGASLSERAPVGSLAVASDHIDVSNARTLEGLARSKRGPLFPDQSRLHVETLRLEALALASEVGIELVPAVIAAVAGPRLETPAEARYLRTAGADVSVQGVAHLLAGAVHAGLGALVIAAVASQAGQAADLRRILESAERQAPALEDLVLRLAGPVAALAHALSDEAASS